MDDTSLSHTRMTNAVSWRVPCRGSSGSSLHLWSRRNARLRVRHHASADLRTCQPVNPLILAVSDIRRQQERTKRMERSQWKIKHETTYSLSW